MDFRAVTAVGDCPIQLDVRLDMEEVVALNKTIQNLKLP